MDLGKSWYLNKKWLTFSGNTFYFFTEKAYSWIGKQKISIKDYICIDYVVAIIN